MARHRSEAPPAPRHAWNEPDDGVGDPFGDPRGGPSTGVDLASPPAGFRVDPFGDRDPFGDPTPPGLRDALRARDPRDVPGDRPAPSAPFGLPVLPEVMPEPATRAPAPAVVPPPRPATGPTPAPAPAVRHAEVPAPRPASAGGRHSWITPPAQAEPVTRAAEPAPTPPPARAEPASGPASGPLARPGQSRDGGRRRATRGTVGHDPETTPLDLAAIALASARTATGSHRIPPTTGSIAAITGRSGPLALAGAGETGGHRIAAGGRGLAPTRAAGMLAVAGALVSAGVAVLSSGSMLASADAPGPAAAPAAVQHQEAPAAAGGSTGSGATDSGAADSGY